MCFSVTNIYVEVKCMSAVLETPCTQYALTVVITSVTGGLLFSITKQFSSFPQTLTRCPPQFKSQSHKLPPLQMPIQVVTSASDWL